MKEAFNYVICIAYINSFKILFDIDLSVDSTSLQIIYPYKIKFSSAKT